MTQILFIAVAGALGTLLRYAITHATRSINVAGFAWGTLLANALGCLLIGVVSQPWPGTYAFRVRTLADWAKSGR